MAARVQERVPQPILCFVSPAHLDFDLVEFSNCMLSESERKRASKLVVPTARTAFIVSHGYLKAVLSVYLKLPAHDIDYTTGRYGKPYVDPPLCAFSFSHTNNHWAVALHLDPKQEIGIDIENTCRFLKNPFRLKKLVLTQKENQELLHTETTSLSVKLARIWVRKEALLKAAGMGLSSPMAKLHMGSADGPTYVNFQDSQGVLRYWTVFDLQLPASLAGAIAVSGHHPSGLISLREVSFSRLLENRSSCISKKWAHP